MPSLKVRKPTEVPPPRSTSRAVAEAQAQYDAFIQAINGDVGELELEPGENPRGVKVRLRRAATRLGRELEIWDADGRVYFRLATKRGRPAQGGLDRARPVSRYQLAGRAEGGVGRGRLL